MRSWGITEGSWTSVLLAALLSCYGVTMATSQRLQPIVTTIESFPARRSAGVIALPEGSPWCQGNPTVWFPGHHNHLVDSPSCLINGTWTPSKTARLNIIDDLNAMDGNKVIDRHDCGVIDANDDGLMDIYCLVGANRGTQFGYNELYLTQKDGSLLPVERHGLQKITTLRSRNTVVLNGPNTTQYVFISTVHGERKDGLANQHQMYRKTGTDSRRHNSRFFEFFKVQRYPWRRYTDGYCAIKADINQDGRDDLIVCNGGDNAAFLIVQAVDGTFVKNIPNMDSTLYNWRNARVADFDGDGIPDIAVVYRGYSNSTLRVFRGTGVRPYFDFSGESYYSMELPHAAPDLEVLDVNGDGFPDIYVVQDDQTRRYPNGTSISDVYCSGVRHVVENWWSGGPNRITPPTNYRPPPDLANDLLFLGQPSNPRRFQPVTMNHAEPGCGYRVKKFGDKSLLLAQGSFDRPGHQLMLNW